MKKSNFTVKPFDLTKGARWERGRVYDQGMIPRRLSNLYYHLGGPLVARGATSSYAGVFDPYLSVATGNPQNGAFVSGAVVTDVTTDGSRVFGKFSTTRYSTTMPDAGLVSESLVCELTNPANPYWMATTVPAPKAVRPLMSLPAAAYPSLGDNGAGGFIATRFTASRAHTYEIQGESSRQESTAIDNPGRVTYDFYMTRAIGGGYFLGIKNSEVVLCKSIGPAFRFWKLRDAAGSDISLGTAPTYEQFDSLKIDSNIYFAYHPVGAGGKVDVLRYEIPTESGGSHTSTPTNLDASAESSFSVSWGASGTFYIDAIAISSQTSPAEFRLATSGRRGSSGYVSYARRDLTTLASIGIVNSSATALEYTRALTCNGNIVLCERSSSADEFGTVSFGYSYADANTSRVYSYELTASSITEAPLFGTSVVTGSLNPTDLFHVERRLYSHISSGGLVCIGGNIYRVAPTAAPYASGASIAVLFLAKAVDLYPSMALGGVISASGSSASARGFNSMSRWVSEQYVALPMGSGLRAKTVLDPGAASPSASSPSNFTAGYENDSLVIVSLDDAKLSCIGERNGVTCFGHGFAIAPTLEAAPWFCVDRPYISVAFSGPFTRQRDWSNGELLSYRLVITQSIGGVESYCSSATATISVGAGNVDDDIIVSAYINNRVGSMRWYLYRNSSTGNGAGDFYLITSGDVDPFSAYPTQTFGIRDARLANTQASRRPLDPTGGGELLQGLFISGMRDIVSTAERNYVLTHDAIYPCQPLVGDDRLPSPMPDSVIPIPPLYGSGQYLGSVADSLVVCTDSTLLAVSGSPPNAAGQGGSQGAYLLLNGISTAAKPALAPDGLFVPHEDGVIMVDASRSTVEVAKPIIGGVSSDFPVGACAYWSKGGQLIVFGGYSVDARSPYDFCQVLDAPGQRWTSFGTAVSSSDMTGAGLACPTAGQWAGGIYFGTNGGYIAAEPTSYADVLIDTGWNSYDGRFVETAVRRVLVDGAVGSDPDLPANVSFYTSRNLRYAYDAPDELTVADFSEYRDGEGFRFTFSLAEQRGSSHRHELAIAPDGEKFELGSAAVETRSDVNKYTAADADE